jgi:hypothetical protein
VDQIDVKEMLCPVVLTHEKVRAILTIPSDEDIKDWEKPISLPSGELGPRPTSKAGRI